MNYTDAAMPEISAGVRAFVDECERECADVFRALDEIEKYNTEKVLLAFQRHRIALRHFAPSNGYGYDDIGRDTLDRLYADIMGAEDALVRPQIASGTHALALCLQGLTRPGGKMLAASGRPYDTLEQVIGLSGEPGTGSLRDYGIGYDEVDLTPDGKIDLPAVLAKIDDDTQLVTFQRSRGYAWRPCLSVDDIGEAARAIHAKRPDVCVMVDNCYGEFTRKIEPTDVDVDVIAGSLIKNPGGGIAPTGGYIAGRHKYVEMIAYRLTSPGIGREVGSYYASYQPFYQGLFIAPHITMQAVKTSALAARVFGKLGYDVNPAFDAPREDIIQAIRFGEADKLIKFVQAIQLASPVDSEALPEPWDMPGYQDQVIMAAGTFVGGSSIELSADSPIRPPYIAYMQGSLTFAHGRLGIMCALERLGGIK